MEEQLEPPELSRLQVLSVMGVTALLLLAIAKFWQRLGHVALFPLEFTPTACAYGLMAAIGITMASQAAYRLWPEYRQSADYYLNLILGPLALADLIWLGLLPGLSEELLFRGVMLPAWGAGWLAVILTSCLFGLLHLNSPAQWPYAAWAAIIGGVLGAIALITGNLLVPVLAHIGTNALAGVLWKLGRTRSSES